MSKLRVLIWNEFVHENIHEKVKSIYHQGIHEKIKTELISCGSDFQISTATLEEPDHGLTDAVLSETDVLIWWGHMAHNKVEDTIAKKVQSRVLQGMGFIALHSAHFSKVFKLLMGTTCDLKYREAGEKERLWVCNPGHPITEGIDDCLEIDSTEMYGEPFDIPPPDEQVFISWFEGGEVFRSGNCWRRGNGKIFYFRPGHETYPIFHNKAVIQVIYNAIKWAAPQGLWLSSLAHVPVNQAREKIEDKGD